MSQIKMPNIPKPKSNIEVGGVVVLRTLVSTAH